MWMGSSEGGLEFSWQRFWEVLFLFQVFKDQQLRTYHPSQSISPCLSPTASLLFIYNIKRFTSLNYLFFPPPASLCSLALSEISGLHLAETRFSEEKIWGWLRGLKRRPMQSAVVLWDWIMGNWEKVFNRKPTICCNATVVKVRLSWWLWDVECCCLLFIRFEVKQPVKWWWTRCTVTRLCLECWYNPAYQTLMEYCHLYVDNQTYYGG